MKGAFYNKRRVAVIVCAFLLLLSAAGTMNLHSSRQKELDLLKARRDEMKVLKKEYLSLNADISAIVNRHNGSNVQGIIQAVDEIFNPLGLREKVKTVKQTGQRETPEGFEEEADVTVEKIGMNEMVNILYRIDTMPMAVTVRKVSLKKSFDAPHLLNLAMTIAFLKPK
jgi:predicted RND superfamily exporter protein